MKVTCKNCETPFNKIPSQVKKTKNHFCTRSCAAKYNNSIRDPSSYRQPQGECKTCTVPISAQLTYCADCWRKKGADYLSDSESIKDVVYRNHHVSSAFAKIRSRARGIAKKQKWCKCKNCGYSKHIEIAHKKAISEFSDDTLVSEVNTINNLLPLCRNCHWEFDNGFLIID